MKDEELVPGHCDICEKPCSVPRDGHKRYFNVTCGSDECLKACDDMLQTVLGHHELFKKLSDKEDSTNAD